MNDNQKDLEKIKHPKENLDDTPYTDSDKAREDENSKYDFLIKIRTHFTSAVVACIYTGAFFIIALTVLYFFSLISSSLWADEYTLLYTNVQAIFYPMVDLVPWILLVILGDKTLIKNFLLKQDH